MKKLSIIIPAYNEEKTILSLLQKVVDVQLINEFEKEIIIVNDCSKDSTESLVLSYQAQHPELPIIYTKQPVNSGKGAAIRRGIKLLTGDFVIIQDADLEYDPKDYNLLLQKVEANNLSVIYGSRFLKKENKHSYKAFYLGGRLVTMVTNILYCQHLTDEPTCYKMIQADLLKSLNLKCDGFEFCPEVTAKIAKKRIKIQEEPIEYYPRTIEDGKKIKWTDGVEAIWTLLKYRFVN